MNATARSCAARRARLSLELLTAIGGASRMLYAASATPWHEAGDTTITIITRPGRSPTAISCIATPGSDLNRVAEDVSAALSSLIASGHVRVRRYDSWVAVDISTDILFGSGVARLSVPAIEALHRLADTLKTFPNAVRVEGHTDDRRINTAAFPSNWELSAARAASVVHLFMDRGIAARRLAVVGYGEFRPTMPNSTVTGRNANRRVEVLIFNRDGTADGLR